DGNESVGLAPAAPNVISRNTADGIVLASTADRNDVTGNYIGVTASGDAALPNGFSGVDIQGSTSSITFNVISGNEVGVLISGGGGNSLKGNRIGTNAAGTAAIPNQFTGVI